MEAGLQNRIIENNILKLMIRFFSKYIFSLYKFNRNSFKKFRSIYFSKIDNENIKIIFTLPRSGTHILYGVLSSYLEQIYNKGNGIPKFFDEALQESGFARIHKSYLVNVNEITKYVKGKGGSVVLSNGKELSVSASKKAELLTYFK